MVAFIDSASCRSPAMTPMRSGNAPFSFAATTAKASFQVAGESRALRRIIGLSSR